MIVLALWKDGLAKYEVLDDGIEVLDDGIEVLQVAPSVTGWLGHLLKAVGWCFAVLWMLCGQLLQLPQPAGLATVGQCQILEALCAGLRF